MSSIPRRRLLAVALLLVLALLPALPRHVALAQDGLSEAQALMDDARSHSGDLDPLVDDESFTFEQDATDVSLEVLAADAADFYVTYTLIVPRDGVDEPYDHGVEFRSNGEEFFQFIILSSSEDATRPVWGVLTATDLIAEGELPRRVYNTEPGEVNVVELAVVGEKAAFAVNGDVVGLVELVGGLATGAVALNTGITNMGTVRRELRLVDHPRWRLVAGG